jgi:hypothetical protein
MWNSDKRGFFAGKLKSRPPPAGRRNRSLPTYLRGNNCTVSGRAAARERLDTSAENAGWALWPWGQNPFSQAAAVSLTRTHLPRIPRSRKKSVFWFHRSTTSGFSW